MSKLENYWEKRTLIIGGLNTGKTELTAGILGQVLVSKKAKTALLDLAPELTMGIGGKLGVRPDPLLSYYTTTIIPPRLTARSSEEAEAYALQNAKAIEVLFSSYMENPCKVLFINDVSLYLQAGDLGKLLLVLNTAPTVIMNGYFGSGLGGGKLGKRERQQMKALQKTCDHLIKPSIDHGRVKLTPPPP
jgi:hypothetical protein